MNQNRIRPSNKKTASTIKFVVEKLIKLCEDSKRGFLFCWEDSSGLHEMGTKNLLAKFRSHGVESWTRASNLGIYHIA